MSETRKPQARRLSEEPEKAPKRHPVLKCFLFVLLLMLGAGGYAAWEAYHFLNTPPQLEGQSKIVDIKPGASVGEIARQLHEAGALTNVDYFKILARVTGQGPQIKAGQFLINTGWEPRKLLSYLVSGKTILHRITIREGLPWWEVGALLEKEGMCRAEDFAKVIHDKDFLLKYAIPFATAEGFLYPDTYLVPRPRELNERAARSFAGRMIDTFWRKTTPEWKKAGLGKRPEKKELARVLTLASIVEKETGLPEERARVAGVYANRLKKGMLLQADPTVVYGLGTKYEGKILKSHLKDASNPYNTYQNQGLPPGPICSPGLASIKAALSPEKHNFYYFVATGRDRGHVFSTTLSQHNRAVQAYRKAMREKER